MGKTGPSYLPIWYLGYPLNQSLILGIYWSCVQQPRAARRASWEMWSSGVSIGSVWLLMGVSASELRQVSEKWTGDVNTYIKAYYTMDTAKWSFYSVCVELNAPRAFDLGMALHAWAEVHLHTGSPQMAGVSCILQVPCNMAWQWMTRQL